MFQGNFSDNDQRTAILCISGKNLKDELHNTYITDHNSKNREKCMKKLVVGIRLVQSFLRVPA
jgi:hypothetical protein